MRLIDADALIEFCAERWIPLNIDAVNMQPTIQPVATDTNVGDKISKFIDGLEETFAYIREREGGDSVCGLCEYDGAYIGESGDWCNECPGFNRDDCFKLSDKIRKKWTEEIIKALPTVQPEVLACGNGELVAKSEPTDIDAREAVYNLAEKIGIHQLYALTVELRGEPIQPEPQWIPVSERLPESGTYCLFTVFEHDSELEATTIETVYGCFDDYGERRYWSWEDEVGKRCIDGEEQLDGYHDEIIEKVLAWMPLPEAYKPNK